jgi:serine/threonine-protein kinase
MPDADQLEPGRPARGIDQWCDRFADAWRAGRPIPIEEVLAAAPEGVRPELFRAVLEIEREYRLDVIHGPHAGRSFPLFGHATFAIGRQPGPHLRAGQHITLPDDLHLSRAHCLIEINPPLARVVDLGSKSGTFVNGQKVSQADLRDGDEVRAGLTVFRVRVPTANGFGTLSMPEEPNTHTYSRTEVPPAIPGYRIVRELGRGAMGVVYLAKRDTNGEEVAIKTLLPAIPPTRTALGRFIREADVLRQLSHPNIVAFREAGSVGPLLFFVMEYVPGTSASAAVRNQGQILPARVLSWAGQFLSALAYAHEKGYVHRDVKPSNLLVVGAPGAETVKVSDFGLARAYEESSMSGLTIANTSGGTPAFMPPEQVNDFRNVRPSADQYAAAATIYQLLTGRTVYERSQSTQEMLRRILVEDPIPLRPDAHPLPAPFGPVLVRALARNPDDRYPDLRAMLAALNAG